jgi:uncharacterized protein (TIGR02453 family)
MNSTESFNGFSTDTLKFLRSLKRHNNHEWFEAHRQDYQEYLLNPMRSLVAELGPFMLTIDQDFEITPAVNKAISRIFRDIRFSKDKSPFRARMWVTFKRRIKDWQDAPTYYFQITPDSYDYGMGFYQASSETMQRFRNVIDEHPKEFRKAISFFSKQNVYTLEGETYKKIRDKSKPEDIQTWYQRKNFYLASNHKIDKRLFSRMLLNDLIRDFALLAPFYKFIWEVKSGGI